MTRGAIRIAAALLCCIGASAQPLAWTLIAPIGPSPSPRLDGAVAYDPAGRQILMFGGADGTGLRNDLWAFSFDRQTWSQIQAAGGPPGRTYHTVVFDSTRRRLIIFGGQGPGNMNDTWEFDIAAGSWQQLSPSGTLPEKRHGHSAIYDAAHDRMVVSHGFIDGGRTNTTWALDFATNRWNNITPSGTKPLQRCLHHAAYDARNSQMYIYGGCSSGYGPCPQGDLWSFDLNTNQWTERTPANSPPPRYSYSLAFDANRNKLILFGGQADSLLNDTREFDPATSTWAAVSLNSAGPTARTRQEAAWADEHGMVMFGGSTDSSLSADLWTLSYAPPSSIAGVVDAFNGIGGTVAPGEIVSVYGAGLGPAAGIAQSFDPVSLRLPTSSAGIVVTWNGTPAPLYYVSARQLNVQAPYELAGSSEASLIVTVNGVQHPAVKIAVAPVHPSVFPRVFNANGTVNEPANPAARGSIIYFYAGGQGVTTPATATGAAAVGVYPEPVAPVEVNIGSVVFKGQAPGAAGVMQVNARLAADAPAGDSVSLILTVGGVAAEPVMISVK